MAIEEGKNIGQLLIKSGIITEAELKAGVEEQKKSGERLGQTLIRLGHATEEEMLTALAQQLGIVYIKLSETRIDPSVMAKIPANFAKRHNLIPISESNGLFTVAMSDPLSVHVLDDIRLLLGQDVQTVIAGEKEIEKAIKKYYGVGAETMEKIVQDKESTVEIVEAEEKEDLEEMATDASIIKFVNQIILEAFHSRATDIHIEPFEEDLRIRYRIDGVLHETSTPPTIKRFQSAIVSRIKIMADLNIAEKRLPQDGRIRVRIADEDIDLRVSNIPTLFGESVDIRLLSRSSVLLKLEELGLSPASSKKFTSLIERPHGIILVTGPTGCGKTTTLYTALNKINSVEKKIITIEDPIEYQLRGINQMQVRSKIGLTFAMGLRHILRQDPDIILVGEIRDVETAEIAIRAALTGHLVFSTLHTNDAAGGITRLLDMGIEPFLVSSSVEGILAQRLVRIICPKCKEDYRPDPDYLKRIGFSVEGTEAALYRGKGCEECKNTGFKGRRAIFEILFVDESIRKLIGERSSTTTIKRAAMEGGMKTLRETGWEKVREGVTTIEEILRVAEAE